MDESTEEIYLSFYDELRPGVDMLWNNQFEEAEKYFGTKSTTHARHSLHWAEIPVLRAWITEHDSDRQSSIERLTKTVQIAEEHIKMYERGIFPNNENFNEISFKNYYFDTRIVLGDAYTLLAVYQFLEEIFIKGALNLRRGWKMYEACLKDLEDPDFDVDPLIVSSLKFGAGLFLWVCSLLPPGIAQRAASMVGFKANKELGLRYLRESYQAGSLRSHFSGAVLALNHTQLSPVIDKDSNLDLIKEAGEIIMSNTAKFPHGSLFQLTGGLYAISQYKIEEALTFLNSALENSKGVVELPPVVFRILSNCYSLQLNWDKSTEVLETIVFPERGEKDYSQLFNLKIKMDSRMTWHAVKLAASLWMAGKEQESVSLLNWIINADKTKERWVGVLSKQAKRYVRGPNLALFEIMLLTGQLDIIAIRADDSVKTDLMRMLKKAASTLNGAKTKVDAQLIQSKLKKKTGVMTWLTLGYVSGTALSEEDTLLFENRAIYLILKSAVLRGWKETKGEAILKCLNEVLLLKDYVNKLFYVLALLELGKFYGKANAEKAMSYLTEAVKMSGYDWDETVKIRVRYYISAISAENVVVQEEEEVSELKDEEDTDEELL